MKKKRTQYSSLWYTIVTRGKAIQFDIAYSEGTMIQDVLSETSPYVRCVTASAGA